MSELLSRVQGAVGDAYRVESEMPSGGMSRLFLAIEVSLNRRVIVKVLPPELTSEVSEARFRQEAEMLAQLQHPHILPILTTGSYGGLMYYVMPFVAGESLRHRLQAEGRLAIDDAVRILVEVADALSYAHAEGILHRDIKPENILLEGRHAVLTDFGVARALEQARTGGRLTATGTSVGTPGYMSPEQVAGDQVDGRADLYALAVVGYELLAGEPPFVGSTAQAVLGAHLVTPPRPLEEHRPDIPVHVSRAIARALSKNAAERFQTATAFREALEQAGTGPPPARARSPSRRIALGGALLAVAAIAWLLAGQLSRAIDPGLMAAIRSAADSGRVNLLAELLDSAGVEADARAVGEAVGPFLGTLRLEVEPRDAAMALSRVEPLATLRTRPFRPVRGNHPRLLAGEYVFRITAAGWDPRFVLGSVEPGREDTLRVVLRPGGPGSAGRVLVPEGPSPVGGRAPAALLGRTEVTNEEYFAFVGAGGYRDRTLWTGPFILFDTELDWAAAVSRLVDRSGLPGPRGWEGGRFPPGKGDHPVTGITWYEASAYARWAGGELPASALWWRAALGDSVRPYPWGSSGAQAHLRANLEGVETTAVGQYLGGVSPFGVMDMAGNVREWLGDPSDQDGRRLTAGGSWQEPLYSASLEWMARFTPGSTSEGLGFRVAWAPPQR